MAADLAAGLLSAAAPSIQWYPGHIAKAERALTANLEKVDLVIEVRDARIPLATGHPRLRRWIGARPHLLVLNRRDMVPAAARQDWDRWFRAQGQLPWWCDARAGTGVQQLQQAAIRAGEALNARRAGVTRSLRWVRLGQELDLLDAPGVLPPRLDDQRAALHLAICDDIGQAAYDGEAVALAFVQLLAGLEPVAAAGVPPGLLQRRYGVALQRLEPLEAGVPGAPGGAAWFGSALDPAAAAQTFAAGAAAARTALPADAAGWLAAAASRHTSGDTARMAQRLLDDFRRGQLGALALELPPPASVPAPPGR